MKTIMKKIMVLLVFICVLSSCTTISYDAVSAEIYPIKILVQDSVGHCDTAYVDIATALIMKHSLLNSGDLIPILHTPVGYIHTLDHPERLQHVEITSIFGAELHRKINTYPENLMTFVGILTPIPESLEVAVEAYLSEHVLIN